MSTEVKHKGTNVESETVADGWGNSFTEVMDLVGAKNDGAESDPNEDQTMIAALKGIQAQNVLILAALDGIKIAVEGTLDVSIT